MTDLLQMLTESVVAVLLCPSPPQREGGRRGREIEILIDLLLSLVKDFEALCNSGYLLVPDRLLQNVMA